MGLHLEISKIRLARKADRRVQHLSSGNLPLAGFEVTPEGGIEPEQFVELAVHPLATERQQRTA
jgi:hypothetical protein